MKLADGELEQLSAKAEEQQVSVQGLLVAAAMSDGFDGARDLRELAVELMKVQRLVGRSADNMNQIAKKANTVHEVPSDFRPALAEARTAWQHCEVVLDNFDRLVKGVGL